MNDRFKFMELMVFLIFCLYTFFPLLIKTINSSTFGDHQQFSLVRNLSSVKKNKKKRKKEKELH